MRIAMRLVAAGLAALGWSCATAPGEAPPRPAQAETDRALAADPRRSDGAIAPVLTGLGDLRHPVTTSSERAQQFFDQGLRLTYGFNHREALRAFKEAARLDPDCAMAYWGWALALGPNLNLPMSEEAASQAWEAIQLALVRRPLVSERERAYIDALAERYAADPNADRAPLDAAYADAMGRVSARYPDDLDAATLYAAARMNQSPWNYWTRDGRPRERTPEILATLESVIERDSRHIGALHYLIHAIEPVDPDRGEAAADLLRGLTPSAGHLVHMPSHIYMQVGRYADSFEANTAAVRADEDYITQCRAQGIYPLNYYPHNLHFLSWAATLQGRSETAIASARKVASKVPPDRHGDAWALHQTFLSLPLATLVRFGRWDEILAEPKPGEHARYWLGMWHYARGLAHVRQGRVTHALAERDELARISDDPSTPEVLVGFSDAATLLRIAVRVLTGEIEAGRGDTDAAIGHLARAQLLEDGLLYNEPPDWFLPVRHTLGAVLLEAGLPHEAEVVYWRDLEKRRDNGYALFGLWQSLRAQGRTQEAADVEARFRAAWQAADVDLTASRF